MRTWHLANSFKVLTKTIRKIEKNKRQMRVRSLSSTGFKLTWFRATQSHVSRNVILGLLLHMWCICAAFLIGYSCIFCSNPLAHLSSPLSCIWPYWGKLCRYSSSLRLHWTLHFDLFMVLIGWTLWKCWDVQKGASSLTWKIYPRHLRQGEKVLLSTLSFPLSLKRM